MAKKSKPSAMSEREYFPQFHTRVKTHLRAKNESRRILDEIVPNLEVEDNLLDLRQAAEISLRNTARESRIREASRPLYLKRYE